MGDLRSNLGGDRSPVPSAVYRPNLVSRLCGQPVAHRAVHPTHSWARSGVGELFSSFVRRSKVKDTHAWRTINNLMPLLFFLSACLLVVFINPFSWLFGDPLFVEYCSLEVDNQSGKTLHLTPIYVGLNSYSAVRLYRTTFPNSPTYQQSNIAVKPGDQVSLPYDCSQRISKLYICDLEGECYVSPSVYQHTMIKSLESLAHPDAALEAALQSFPEHNYSLRIDALLCFLLIVALLGGVYWLNSTKPAQIPYDI